jgi:hypothetical protein
MPERTLPVSAQAKLTSTFSLFQPAALAAGEREPLTTGFVLSMETPVSVSEASFPASSAQVASALWSAPSSVKVCETCSATAPESSSTQLQVTVTSSLFQPSALAAGRRAARVIVGSVKSMSNAALATPACEFPAASEQEPDSTVTALPCSLPVETC